MPPRDVESRSPNRDPYGGTKGLGVSGRDAAEARRLALRPRPRAGRRGAGALRDSRGRVHRADPRHRARRQRRGDNDSGLVLTIGYLITEASVIWLATNKGTVVGGYPLAYDQNTGFGLVQPLGKLGLKPIVRGSASAIRVGENVVVAGHGWRAHALK